MLIALLSYQIIPNLIFILAVAGILLLILRRLPEAAALQASEPKQLPVEARLLDKGLPAMAVSKIQSWLKFWIKKIWNFALEAKDLRPTAVTGYKIRKIFGNKFAPQQPIMSPPLTTHEIKSERYYLDTIKLDPKNLGNYDALGRYYLEKLNFQDARDIYDYLAKHEQANADYHGRAAYCCYKLGDFPQAVIHYEKSVSLDTTQPNRFYNYGLSLEACGKMEEAIKAFKQAIVLEPKNSKFYQSLGTVFVKMKNLGQAREALQNAQKLDPENESLAARLRHLH
ncbi:MAG: tetratricopeptide repeat protein [Patescibacteria group bacterium]|nr:tetratricopeptide repeat protein [Patescibacteria group bacterium]